MFQPNHENPKYDSWPDQHESLTPALLWERESGPGEFLETQGPASLAQTAVGHQRDPV